MHDEYLNLNKYIYKDKDTNTNTGQDKRKYYMLKGERSVMLPLQLIQGPIKIFELAFNFTLLVEGEIFKFSFSNHVIDPVDTAQA